MSNEALSPTAVLDRATKAAPVVKYAVGLTGVAAAIAIVRGLLPDVGFAAMVPILVGAIVCMAVLLILSAAMKRQEAALVGTVFLWAVCLFIIAFMVLTISAIAIGQPRAWAETILPKHTVVVTAPVGPAPPPGATNATAPAPAKAPSVAAADVGTATPPQPPADATATVTPAPPPASPPADSTATAVPPATTTAPPPVSPSVARARILVEKPIPSLSQALTRQFAMTHKAN
jgi:multisubunit Na+/H+ antiporter MnhB subunit